VGDVDYQDDGIGPSGARFAEKPYSVHAALNDECDGYVFGEGEAFFWAGVEGEG